MKPSQKKKCKRSGDVTQYEGPVSIQKEGGEKDRTEERRGREGRKEGKREEKSQALLLGRVRGAWCFIGGTGTLVLICFWFLF